MATPLPFDGRPSGCPVFMAPDSRLRRIDQHVRRDHACLEADDVCFYYGEYVAGAGIKTPTNDLILDLKKEPARRGKYDWRYKVWAIEDCARVLRLGLDIARLEGVTLVPVPPSKRRDHRAYDDRMLEGGGGLCGGARPDWRGVPGAARRGGARGGGEGGSANEGGEKGHAGKSQRPGPG